MISYDSMAVEVTARMGNRTDIAPRLGRWINYAFYEILLNPRFSFFELDKSRTFNAVDDQSEYDIVGDIGASDVWYILSLSDSTNRRKLRRTHQQVIDSTAIVKGQPTSYFRFGSAVTFYPTPDATTSMLMRYRRRPANLEPGTTFAELGDEWEEPIVVLATVKGFQALEQTDKAAMHRSLLEQLFQSRYDVPQLEDMDSTTTIEPEMLFPIY